VEISAIEFSEYVECIWEAYNLKGCKKAFLRLKYFFTIPFLLYVKYLIYVAKLYSFCESRLLRFGELFQNNCERCINFHNRSREVQVWVICLGCPFVLTYFVMNAGGMYAIWFVIYISYLFPFLALSYPLKLYFFGFNIYSFWFVVPSLATPYACFFPQIKIWMLDRARPEIEPEHLLENVLESFQIKPKKINVNSTIISTKQKTTSSRDFTYHFFLSLYFFGRPRNLFSFCLD